MWLDYTRLLIVADWNEASTFPQTVIQTLSFLMITFQRVGSQSLRKAFQGCKTDKSLGEDLQLRAAEKEFTILGFLK